MPDVEALEAMEATLAEPRCRCPAPFQVEIWFWNFLVHNEYDIVRLTNLDLNYLMKALNPNSEKYFVSPSTPLCYLKHTRVVICLEN